MFNSVRDALRSLGKQPRFLAIASLTLALGIGAVTAIFSVVNGVLFNPLPYPHAGRLVNIWSTAPGLGYDQFPLSPDLFLFYRKHNAVFEDMALFQERRANLTDGGAPEVVPIAVTTHSYFATLGAGLTRGRFYTEAEDAPDAGRVAVISHRLWTRRYGADPALIGRTIRLDGEVTDVVGIGAAWLDRAGTPDVWVPARFDDQEPPTGAFGWNAIGRLREGVSLERAAADLSPLVRRAMEEYIQSENYRAFLTEGGYRPLVHAMKEDVVGSLREPLWILLGTVGILLLVACGNVANLCLMRAESRQREIAVRAAIGAGRASLVRMLLVEAVVLAAIGTLIGVAVCAIALPLLLRLAPATIPRLDEIHIDGVVLAFAALTALVSAVLFGLIPAIRYTRPNVVESLRHGGRSATDRPDRVGARRLLVVAQTALAMVLLVGSGLLARSFARLVGAEQAFVADNVLTFRLALPSTTYPSSSDVVRFSQQLVDRLSQLPGVDAAGAATELPIAESPSGRAFEIDGRISEPGRLPPIVHYSSVTPGYFTTLRIPLLRGADFDSGDLRDGVRTIIINKSAADQYWPGQDPIGRRIRDAGASPPEQRPWFTVKGVVADVRHQGLREPPRVLFYFPLNPTGDRAPRGLAYAVRGARAEAMADSVRQTVWSLNPDLPVAAMQTMNDVVERSMTQFTFTMLTLGIAAAITLVLGAVGLYGVLSYAVTLRTREIGVRIALGASPSRVKRGVIGNAAVMTGIGLLVGVAGALALTRFLGGLLYETKPLDPPTFVGMAVLLLAVGVAAAYVPARRAASVSPLEAMRAE